MSYERSRALLAVVAGLLLVTIVPTLLQTGVVADLLADGSRQGLATIGVGCLGSVLALRWIRSIVVAEPDESPAWRYRDRR